MRKLLTFILFSLGLAFGQTGTLDIAVDQSPVGLDPHIVTAFSSFAVIGQIYDGLLETNAQLQLEPALAESWQVSDDGLTYTFELRPGVRFHNGRSFTADDVVYSFDRIMNEETGSPQASRFSEVASVRARDDRTVVFELSEPFAPFLANLTNLTVVPREVVEANGDLQQVAVGTGPFKLAEVVPDTYILLEANPDYYRPGEPGVAALKFHIVPEAATRAAGLRTGSYDLLPNVDPATAETLKRARGIELLTSQDLAYSLLGLNVTREPFDDPRVREAINLAINRDEVVEAVYFGNAAPGTSLSPGLSDWVMGAESFPCYRHNPATARVLLEAADYDGSEIDIITFGTMRVISDLAQVLEAQLREAGFNARVTVEEFGSFVQRWRNSDFDAFVSLNGGSVDPDGYYFRTFSSGGSTNVFNYSDARIDALLKQGRTTSDNAARKDIYEQIQREVTCKGPIAHIAYGTLFTALDDSVAGFVQMPTRGLRYLRNVQLK